jgi:prepilin-type N-terminal cleavage/methylation domain-containing protein
MMCNLKNGFTLAEVLITLLILGVITSMVIPGIISNTNEAEYNVALKKAYSDLSNTIMLIQANNNGKVNVGIGDSTTQHRALRDEFCNVMTCIKMDKVANIFGSTNYKHYKGNNSLWPTSYPNSIAATLNNGNLIAFFNMLGCDNNGINACGQLDVDINGNKGPNMWGKDHYSFWVIRDNVTKSYSILPTGAIDGFTCEKNSNNDGTSVGCTFQRLNDPKNMP